MWDRKRSRHRTGHSSGRSLNTAQTEAHGHACVYGYAPCGGGTRSPVHLHTRVLVLRHCEPTSTSLRAPRPSRRASRCHFLSSAMVPLSGSKRSTLRRNQSGMGCMQESRKGQMERTAWAGIDLSVRGIRTQLQGHGLDARAPPRAPLSSFRTRPSRVWTFVGAHEGAQAAPHGGEQASGDDERWRGHSRHGNAVTHGCTARLLCASAAGRGGQQRRPANERTSGTASGNGELGMQTWLPQGRVTAL